MTYAEAVTHKAAIEAALLSGSRTVTVDGMSITYQDERAMRAVLAQLNRDIAAYSRRTSNRNPYTKRVQWRR